MRATYFLLPLNQIVMDKVNYEGQHSEGTAFTAELIAIVTDNNEVCACYCTNTVIWKIFDVK